MKIVLKDPNKLKEMIIKKGYSQRSFGRATGISSPYVAQITNGTRNPSPKIAKKITDELEVEFDDIFCIQNGYKCEQNKIA